MFCTIAIFNVPVDITSKNNLPKEATDKIVSVTGYKRAMVKTMTKSGSIPQFGYCDEVRMDALIRQVLHNE